MSVDEVDLRIWALDILDNGDWPVEVFEVEYDAGFVIVRNPSDGREFEIALNITEIR